MPTTATATSSINWTSKGDGDVLVLLHGLGGDIGFWETELVRLSSRFQTIAIDLRGSGETPATVGGHTIADLADDVAAVLDDAGVDTAHVLGFSMGGLVAQEFALRHPARLRRLVLASTFAVMNPQARMFLDAVSDVLAATDSQKKLFDLVCPWLFAIDFIADPAHRDFSTTPTTKWTKVPRLGAAVSDRKYRTFDQHRSATGVLG